MSCELAQNEFMYVNEVFLASGPCLTSRTVKQFIRNVRAAKTIADERAVVQKESAAIRASFREESGDHSVRYIWNTRTDAGISIVDQNQT